MKLKIFALVAILAYVSSYLLFCYYLVNFYEPGVEPAYLYVIWDLLGAAGISAVIAGVIWLVRRRSYWISFQWSMWSLVLVLSGMNLFATYLMHWSVNR